MPSIVMNVVYGFIALSLLILVHELGHYLVARLANVKVLAFSLGFGKKLINIKKAETEYAISAVPLGGYVKLLGESPDDEVKEEEISRSYSHKPPFVRILIAFAGPFFNIIFAFFLFYCVFLSGYNVLSTKVGKVETGYPAYEAGIREGDMISSINGQSITEWSELMDLVSNSKAHILTFTVNRNGNTLDYQISPKEIESKNIFGETIKRKVIGITASNEFLTKKETLIGAVGKAGIQTYNLTRITIVGIVKLIEGSISPKQVGGPLLILEVAGKQAKEGAKNLIYFIAIISINLAVINLLPIPILDGGHIMFHLVEIIIRRKISQRFIDIAQKAGMGVLLAIMVLAFFNDLMRIFYGR
ncbi:MAG: RIP metalloprotease RseP [Syntrophorhabdaceae bacterium]|nr:RIP metalloprotease RseP [Syntrophorhabdaceae bacterium]MBP8697812.1 RIP metalloprotease RseP [Syntrophorhabdaceae bacterium]MDI9560914.1 RIP metalloprotease RseP [Pseudomonadota bacterium]HQG50279.1 RIP metalloprotease RseP [Syntrophorhabdaceae bacterium]